MLLLVLGDNYLVLYVGWEGVGLASYLLIGFWQYKNSAAVAAKKAFIVNRVGDAGLTLADRKSTRLNSSHLVITYAVFCLKHSEPRSPRRPAALGCATLRRACCRRVRRAPPS